MGRQQRDLDWYPQARAMLKHLDIHEVARRLRTSEEAVKCMLRRDAKKKVRTESIPDPTHTYEYRIVVQRVDPEIKMEACRAFASGAISRQELSSILSGKTSSELPDRSEEYERLSVQARVPRKRRVQEPETRRVYETA